MHVLSKDLSYEEVTEIFVRVNSLGVKLRGSDLALAQITARWPNSLKLFESFQDECEDHGMTFDVGLLVRAMVVFATNQSRFDRVSKIPINELKKGWDQAKISINYAINFMRTNAGIEDESLLSSPLFIIVIGYFSYINNENISQENRKLILQWLYTANAKGRYSRGSTETLLDADLSSLAKGNGPQALLDTLKQQFGRLNFEIADFVGRNSNSPLFSLVFLALKNNGAKDWYTGLGLSFRHQGNKHYIEHHHIFPKAILKGKYEKSEINEIANLAFISGGLNRDISSKEPIEYLSKIIQDQGRNDLMAQGIPLDEDLLKLDNFRLFLIKRREILVEIVNNFLQISLG